jgi:hypothetical protein
MRRVELRPGARARDVVAVVLVLAMGLLLGAGHRLAPSPKHPAPAASQSQDLTEVRSVVDIGHHEAEFGGGGLAARA